MKPSEAITSKQRDGYITSATVALKKLSLMPEVQDILNEICISSKNVENAKESRFKLYLTKEGLIKRHLWSECVYRDFFTYRDDKYETRTEDAKVSSRDLREVVEFFDLSVEEINQIQQKLI